MLQLNFVDWCVNPESNTDMDCFISWNEAMYGDLLRIFKE